MILISHRGNTNGKFESYENEPMYIDKAISDGFDVEIDVWMTDGQLFLASRRYSNTYINECNLGISWQTTN